MGDHDDKELIRRIHQGDEIAFERLVNNHYQTIFKFAYKWCGSREDAQDITQNACVKLAQSIYSFEGKSAFTSWLYRLVINTGKDWYKSQKRHPSNPELLETASVQDRTDKQLYAKQVIAAVRDLPDGEKEAVLLVLGEGLSHKEAADALNCKESTISWRIHEARKKLSVQFQWEQNYG